MEGLDIYGTCSWDVNVTWQEAGLLWCNLECLLHSLHCHWMAVIDLVYFAGMCLMLLISCRTCSAGGLINSSLSLVSGEELDGIMMTSSWWCDTSMKYKMLQGSLAVLKGSITSRQMQHMINKPVCQLARPLLSG